MDIPERESPSAMSHLIPERIHILDTTLRDGEQCPGGALTAEEKLEVARCLARLGVDIIEAGFPAASPGDLEAVRRIAREVGDQSEFGPGPSICALARATRRDIDRAWEAVRDAARPRLHLFLATSRIHMEHKLRMSPATVLATVRDMVGYARSLCPDVEYGAEDAGRTDPEFLYRVLEEAIAAGATTVDIPDTVGYTTPEEFGALIRGVHRHVRGVEHAVVSVHCHNDLGLATANTLAGLRGGARQVEVTVNGIGERAGNASLEEVVMALHTRRDYFGFDTSIDILRLVESSRLVSALTGMAVSPNKAIVGSNAFAHQSGVHQDGMLKHRETYEIIRPETVGAASNPLSLGKHSGRNALFSRLRALDVDIPETRRDEVFRCFKQMADEHKALADADLLALAGRCLADLA